MTKPALLMLLSRHPYAENSGRASMLRQRIAQAKLAFEPRLVVFGAPTGAAHDEGITFLPLASPLAAALNMVRLGALPMQTWLYHSASARAAVAHLAQESGAAAVYVDMLRLAPLAADIVPTCARIVDYDDLLSTRYAQAAGKDYEVMGFLTRRVGPLAPIARAFARPILRAESRRCAAYERDLVRHVDLVLFTSPVEAASFDAPNVMAAPPLIAARPLPETIGERLIFLGNMRYGENIVMLRALAAAVKDLEAAGEWPESAVIEAVGDHAPELAAEMDARRFCFLGRVDDLAVLSGAGIFLAPVVGGSGVKLKVLDGMALGCPVVATPKACEGLAVRANRDLLVVADAVGVLRAALKLWGRSTLKRMLARRGHAYVSNAHAPAIGERVAEAMLDAVKRRQETL